jgi:3-hydroxyisobutyrate dehydrogenase
MVGGKQETFERCKDILQAMGQNIVYVGESGMGAAVKLTNQIIVGITVLAIAESVIFGAKLGIDPKIQFQVLSTGVARSFILENLYPSPGIVPHSPASHDFAPGFMTSLMSKDMGLIMSAANELKAPLMMCSLAHQLYEAACAGGLGQKDMSSVINLLRRLSGD